MGGVARNPFGYAFCRRAAQGALMIGGLIVDAGRMAQETWR